MPVFSTDWELDRKCHIFKILNDGRINFDVLTEEVSLRRYKDCGEIESNKEVHFAWKLAHGAKFNWKLDTEHIEALLFLSGPSQRPRRPQKGGEGGVVGGGEEGVGPQQHDPDNELVADATSQSAQWMADHDCDEDMLYDLGMTALAAVAADVDEAHGKALEFVSQLKQVIERGKSVTSRQNELDFDGFIKQLSNGKPDLTHDEMLLRLRNWMGRISRECSDADPGGKTKGKGGARLCRPRARH